MINNRLKNIRMQELMLNKKKFAELIGVAEQQYHRYESGAIIPSLEVCLRIANNLNRKIEDIWFFPEESDNTD